MKELWATGRSDFKGDFFQMDDCRCLPMPSGKIAIIGAGSERRGTQFAAEYRGLQFLRRRRHQRTDPVAPVSRRLRGSQEAGRQDAALSS